MAEQFIGHIILVTLSSPRNAQVQGVVADVANQRLFLSDVTLLWNKQRLPAYTIDSTLIVDLEVSPQVREDYTDNESSFALRSDQPLGQSKSGNIVHPVSHQLFQDPAILSYSKSPSIRPLPPPPPSPPPFSGSAPVEVVSPVMIADGAIPRSPIANREVHLGTGQSSVSSIATALPVRRASRRDSSATATLTAPFDITGMNNRETPTAQIRAGKKGRKNAARVKEAASQTAPGVIELKDIQQYAETSSKKAGRGRGWRQTPLVEAIPRNANGLVKKSRHKSRKSILEDFNGWATEDATDIQDMGEFDFEGNLSKFDKKTVFDDIRRDDTVADGERLVSFNRIAKPGTNEGRNLHFTENVLDGDTEEEIREEHHSSGRGSRRAGSKRPPQSRKGSTFPGVLNLRTESPHPLTRASTTASPVNGSSSVIGTRTSFRLVESNRPCPSISPLQMLELEQLCTSELGLTEDMLSENAGRGIAEVVLKLLDPQKSVLVLVGNHKSGARAIVAARHLRNRRTRVTVCVLGGEREDMLLEVVRKQLAIYKKGGGFTDKWDQLHGKIVTGGHTSGIVVDALLGIHVAFDELRTDDQAVAFEMIRWVNRSALVTGGPHVVSVDVPSGYSGLAASEMADVDGEILAMTPQAVVALGAPKIGLLSTLSELSDVTMQIWVADIGISAAAWQRHGSRRRHGVEFGTEWVVEVKFFTGNGTG